MKQRHEPVIQMTWPLIWLAKHLATLRNGKEARFGALTYGSRRGGEEAHLIGLFAEVAVSHYFNVPIDIEIYERGDVGIDMQINGRSVSVKSTTYWNDPLMRVEKEHFHDGHVYFCTAVDMLRERVKLVGWATSKTVANAEVRVFVPGGPENFVLDRDSLEEFSQR